MIDFTHRFICTWPAGERTDVHLKGNAVVTYDGQGSRYVVDAPELDAFLFWLSETFPGGYGCGLTRRMDEHVPEHLERIGCVVEHTPY